MPLIINTNITAMNAQRHLSNNTSQLAKSMEKLASGFKINRAGDDAAGLQISENLRSQIRGSQKALANVQDGINVLNIADGGLAVITENLQRMRELAVQAANDTYSAAQRTAVEGELDQLSAEITRISDSVEFNGVSLLDGSNANFIIQVGANETANDELDLATAGAANPFGDIDATALGVNDAAIVVTSNATAQTSIGLIDTALDTVNTRRSTIGALTNRLESAGQNLMTAIENLSASESSIRNVDVAAESASLVRNQILQQASASILAQANQSPSLALNLL